MNTEIHELAEAIAKLQLPRIPSTERLWSAKDVAQYCAFSEKYVLDTLVKKKDFPRACRFPSAKGCGHPRWKAREVIAYTDGLFE